jgi:hypothetical protein
MITEADTVTFAGTLELLRFYQQAVDPDLEASRSNYKTPSIRFIVNRLPSKYKWKDLDRLYKKQFSMEFGILSKDESVLCYIPSEELLGETFGEYPFYIELAPKSVFAQKVSFIAWSLFGNQVELGNMPKVFLKMSRNKFRRKVQRTVDSKEEKNTKAIITAFAFSSAILAISFIVIIIIASTANIISLKSTVLNYETFIGLYIGAMIFIVGLYYARIQFSLATYYSARHRFYRALFRRLAQPFSILQYIIIFKLLLFRIGTGLFLLLYILFIVSVIIGAIASQL